MLEVSAGAAVLAAAIVAAGVGLGLPALSFGPYLPSPPALRRRALDVLGLEAGDVLVDLGCGTGDVVLQAWREHGARARGVEISPLLHAICRLRWWWAGRPAAVRFERASLFDHAVADADAVYLYGAARPLAGPVREKLERELGPGARVISALRPVVGWEPCRIVRVGAAGGAALYVYER